MVPCGAYTQLKLNMNKFDYRTYYMNAAASLLKIIWQKTGRFRKEFLPVMLMLKAVIRKCFSIFLLTMLICTTSEAAIDNSPAASAATPGVITTVVGNGSSGYSGDGGPATSAELCSPAGMAVDAAGNLYIADAGIDRVRKVNASGIITTVAGGGPMNSGDGGPATSAGLLQPQGVAVDTSGNLYIADYGRVRKVSPPGIITTVAGNGAYQGMYYGEGGPATKAAIFPESVTVDASGNVYIADNQDNRICKVGKDGIITTVAGNGSLGGYSGDGGPATGAMLNYPTGVAVDAAGDLYIADAGNNRVRKVSPSGIITTVAGYWAKGYSYDHGPAIRAMLNYPTSVAVDASGNLYIADMNNYRVRKVDTSGTITTVAGNGIPNYSGDGGQAVDAELCYPYGVAVDTFGNLYIIDTNAIRKVTAPIPSSSATGQTAIIFTVGQKSYTVGGQSFAMDAAPFISNGRVLVPVRYLADALGAQISWEWGILRGPDTLTKVINITRGMTEVSLTIGSNTMGLTIYGGNDATVFKTSQMDVAPVIINGRTYLPARYVTDAFGCTINWNGTAQTITVLQQPM
jgi:sugar lactone lactonase YvrE